MYENFAYVVLFFVHWHNSNDYTIHYRRFVNKDIFLSIIFQKS